MTEQIWYKDPSILFARDNLRKFVPMPSTPVSEALNAVVRLTIYFTAIMALTGRSEYLMIIPLVMLATFALHQILPDGATLESFSLKTNMTTNSSEYTMPTKDNPFMNVLLTEIVDNPNRPDAAPTNRKDVREKIQKSFQQTSDIYMDTTDLLDQRQAMRTFHTIQSSMVPNNLDDFKKWLAKGNDAPDYSSAPPARNGKLMSEGYVEAKKESVALAPNSTSKPTGTSPSSSSRNVAAE